MTTQYRAMSRDLVPSYDNDASARGEAGDWTGLGEFPTLREAQRALESARAAGLETRIVEADEAVSGGEKIVERTARRR